MDSSTDRIQASSWEGGKNMRCTTERRQLVLEYLLDQRHTTLDALCKEFEVSMSTMRRDILILSCSYPITTFQGGGGGIKIAEGYRLGMKYMTSKQKALLERLSESLSGEELVTMHSILKTFSNPVT